MPHGGGHGLLVRRASRAASGGLKDGTVCCRAVEIAGWPGRAGTRMISGGPSDRPVQEAGTGPRGANLTLSFRNGPMAGKSQLGLK